MVSNVLKLSFIAPTGYGKTTAVQIIQSLYNPSVNIKLSAPLYELQKHFYEFIGAEMRGEQDGELLQFLGHKTQREAPSFLAMRFYERLKSFEATCRVITNDDCRPHNYPFLKNWGFKFVRIDGFARGRWDHVPVDPHHPVEQGLSDLAADLVLGNLGSIEEYKTSIVEMMEDLFHAQEVLPSADNLCL